MTTFSGVGSPGTIGFASGGYAYAFNNLNTTPQPILSLNPQRRQIVVHNPGAVNAFIAPAFVQNTGSDVVLVPSPTSLGGCYLIAPGATILISGECQKPWQAFSASGTNNPLTVEVSNI